MSLFLTGDESLVYGLILGRDSSHPLPLSEICDWTHLSPREVKGIIERLRLDRRLAIGSSRKKPSGYYICKSTEEVDNTIQPMFRQAIQMLRVVRAVAGKERLREWMGQARLWG